MKKDMTIDLKVNVDFEHKEETVEAVILFKGVNKVPTLYINGKEQKGLVSLQYKYVTSDAYSIGTNEFEAIYADDDRVGVRTTKVTKILNDRYE